MTNDRRPKDLSFFGRLKRSLKLGVAQSWSSDFSHSIACSIESSARQQLATFKAIPSARVVRSKKFVVSIV